MSVFRTAVKDYALVIENLSHRYENHKLAKLILNSINLKIQQGELLGLLGPSGCGKTTLLRLIAGFELPTKGKISLHNQEISNNKKIIAPEHRNIGMVFQDYALFPHLNVMDNAMFGLKNQKDIYRVNYLLNLLGIENLKERYPHELSGGQKQRVAITRALAPGTSLILFDEPFCSLDLHVKLRLRSELPNILKNSNASGIMVTHDPEEAMAICDKVAVMNDGKIHQYEKPSKLISKPKTLFVSSFILGNNVLKIKVNKDEIISCIGKFKITKVNQKINFNYLSISPRSIAITKSINGKGIVISKEFLAEYYIYKINIFNEILRIRTDLNKILFPGDRCNINLIKKADLFLYPGGYKHII